MARVHIPAYWLNLIVWLRPGKFVIRSAGGAAFTKETAHTNSASKPDTEESFILSSRSQVHAKKCVADAAVPTKLLAS